MPTYLQNALGLWPKSMTNTYAMRDYIPELTDCYLPTTSTEKLHQIIEDWHPLLTGDWRKRLSHDDTDDYGDNLRKIKQNAECSV